MNIKNISDLKKYLYKMELLLWYIIWILGVMLETQIVIVSGKISYSTSFTSNDRFKNVFL